jgi:hypothetical protein
VGEVIVGRWYDAMMVCKKGDHVIPLNQKQVCFGGNACCTIWNQCAEHDIDKEWGTDTVFIRRDQKFGSTPHPYTLTQDTVASVVAKNSKQLVVPISLFVKDYFFHLPQCGIVLGIARM